MSYDINLAIRVVGDLDNRPPGDMTGRRPPTLESLRDELAAIAGFDPEYLDVYEPGEHAFPEVRRTGPYIACHVSSWYDHKVHVAELSRRHPHVQLWVLGIGHDALYGDIWCQRFSAGQVSKERRAWDSLWAVPTDL